MSLTKKKKRKNLTGGFINLEEDDTKREQSAWKTQNTMNSLLEEINNPEYKNQLATFNFLIEQFNNMSRESLNNIQRLRQDINNLEKTKYHLENKHLQEFEDKKLILQRLIREQESGLSTTEELIKEQKKLIDHLNTQSRHIFEKIKGIEEKTNDKVYNLELKSILLGGSRKRGLQTNFRDKSRKLRTLKKKSLKKKI